MFDMTHLAGLSIGSGTLLALGHCLLLKAEPFSDGALPTGESYAERLRSKGVVRAAVESALSLVVLCALGLFLADLAGLTPLRLASREDSVMDRVFHVMGLGVVSGAACALLFDAVRALLFFPHLQQWDKDCRFSRWKAFCGAALCAGVIEELLFRLILLSALAWGFSFLWPAPDGTPAPPAFWTANILVSMAMAVTHLPIVGSAVPRTSGNVVKLLILVTSVSLLLGYVYWSSGFEVVVLCHGTALLFGWLAISTINRRRDLRRLGEAR